MTDEQINTLIAQLDELIKIGQDRTARLEVLIEKLSRTPEIAPKTPEAKQRVYNTDMGERIGLNGIVSNVQFKTGESARGHWEMLKCKIGNVYASTFDNKLFDLLNEGNNVSTMGYYRTNGNFKDYVIQEVEVNAKETLDESEVEDETDDEIPF